MSNVPAELKYSKEHEWLRKEADGTYTVGITPLSTWQSPYPIRADSDQCCR